LATNDPEAPWQSPETDTRHVALDQGLVRERTSGVSRNLRSWCRSVSLAQP